MLGLIGKLATVREGRGQQESHLFAGLFFFKLIQNIQEHYEGVHYSLSEKNCEILLHFKLIITETVFSMTLYLILCIHMERLKILT